jgi:hypothetical protein
MYPLGHIATALFAATVLSGSVAFAVVGVLLPDIFDKITFNLGAMPCGRALGHSLLFGPILAGIVFAATRNLKFSLSIMLGAYLHLIGDVEHFVPWFYPFVGYDFDCGPTEIRTDLQTVVFEAFSMFAILMSLRYRRTLISLREYIFRKLR